MAMIDIRPPRASDLKWFGLLLLIAAALLGTLLYWKFAWPQAATIVWGAGGALAGVYYLVPAAWQRALYMGWMYAAFPIGWVVSHLLLAAIFYLVLTPIGLLVRLLSHDPLQRRFEPSAPTYWIVREPSGDVERYFKQF